MKQAIDNFIQAINSKRGTTPYDTEAQVVRVEGSTAWVHIPDGVDETPIKKTIEAKKGDIVQVRVSGGRAWITGNATAPPTDDTTAVEVRKEVKETNFVLKAVKTIAEQAQKIAGNTNQYFWHTQEGTDTGAHITEIPQEEFLADPSNGGGNLLARSNGIAVRDGLDELATFGSSKAVVGGTQSNRMIVSTERFAGTGCVSQPLFSFNIDTTAAQTSREELGQISLTDTYTEYSKIITSINTRTSTEFTIGFKKSGESDYVYTDVKIPPDGTVSFSVTTESGDVIRGDYTAGEGYIKHLVTSQASATTYFYSMKNTGAGFTPSFTLGVRNTDSAVGDFSVAIGNDVKATKLHSMAQGEHCRAGQHASAFGYNVAAYGNYSHAAGRETTVYGRGTTAFGEYNDYEYIADSRNRATYAFMIGNGTYGNRSNALKVAWNGNTTIAGTLTQSSDRRLKNHISYLGEDAVDFIRQLKPAHYRKDDADHVGFYAQDVESADKWNCMVGEMNGFKTLGYTELIAPLVAYCQSLEKRIEELEGKK